MAPDYYCTGNRVAAGSGGFTMSTGGFVRLMSVYGGHMAYADLTGGTNWNTGEQHVCYAITQVFYTESGSLALPA